MPFTLTPVPLYSCVTFVGGDTVEGLGKAVDVTVVEVVGFVVGDVDDGV